MSVVPKVALPDQRQPKALIDSLPRMRMTCREFMRLPEYSASYPTGTTPGKMWRRLDGSHDLAFRRAGGKPYWMICQYDPDAPTDKEMAALEKAGKPVPSYIRILRFKPVLHHG